MLLPVNVDKVKAYRKNQEKLVLSLLTIMRKCWKHPPQRPFIFEHHVSFQRNWRRCNWSMWLDQPCWGRKIIILWLSNKSWDGSKYCRIETCGTWIVLCFQAQGFTGFVRGYAEEAPILKDGGCIFSWHVGNPNLEGGMEQRTPSQQNDLPWFWIEIERPQGQRFRGKIINFGSF